MVKTRETSNGTEDAELLRAFVSKRCEESFAALVQKYLGMVLGITLLCGLHTRLSAAVSAASMLVATDVHIVVDDPSLFPLQPVEPVGPIALLVMLLYLLWRGGGAWSVDLSEAR